MKWSYQCLALTLFRSLLTKTFYLTSRFCSETGDSNWILILRCLSGINKWWGNWSSQNKVIKKRGNRISNINWLPGCIEISQYVQLLSVWCLNLFVIVWVADGLPARFRKQILQNLMRNQLPKVYRLKF